MWTPQCDIRAMRQMPPLKHYYLGVFLNPDKAEVHKKFGIDLTPLSHSDDAFEHICSTTTVTLSTYGCLLRRMMKLPCWSPHNTPTAWILRSGAARGALG
jgi:hypothetical protein